MSTATDPLPLTESMRPGDATELASVVRECCASGTPVYPLGGATSLDFGLPARQPGIGLSLAGLDRIIDYPARDMTITVDAGMTMNRLAETLSTEQQRLPIDVPRAEAATIGGVIATGFGGPRCFGQGTIRDYVIGISAVDGTGRAFKGGGRVVKNVAGYDFCKLLTGSLGTLGVITQVTLKLKPIPPCLAWITCRPRDWDDAERLLAALVLHSQTAPVAVELLAGPAWTDDLPASGDIPSGSAGQPLLMIAFEGTDAEVAWQLATLRAEWQSLSVREVGAVEGEAAGSWMRRLAEFPAAPDAPLVLAATVVPSSITPLAAAACAMDERVSLQCHAGNGSVIMRFAEFPEGGLSRALVGKLYRVIAAGHGNIVVLSNPSGTEMTRQSVWGGIDAPIALMTEIKRQFDPRNILNPDRFVYQP